MYSTTIGKFKSLEDLRAAGKVMHLNAVGYEAGELYSIILEDGGKVSGSCIGTNINQTSGTTHTGREFVLDSLLNRMYVAANTNAEQLTLL